MPVMGRQLHHLRPQPRLILVHHESLPLDLTVCLGLTDLLTESPPMLESDHVKQ